MTMNNILPVYTSFTLDARIDNNKSWNPATKPSKIVEKMLECKEISLIPENYVSVSRLPLPPPNERYIKPFFKELNGPSPLLHDHRYETEI